MQSDEQNATLRNLNEFRSSSGNTPSAGRAFERSSKKQRKKSG